MKKSRPIQCSSGGNAMEKASTGIRRRDFLKVLGGGVIVTFSIADFEWSQESAQRQGPPRPGYPDDFNAYLRIGEDGRVTCLVGKIEMGQGAMTSLPQLLAEELEVGLETVDIVMGDTDLCPWDMGTFGSLSIRSFGPVLRAAAAEAREVLLDLASERLRVPRERLQVKAGIVSDRTNPKIHVSYAQLAQGKKIDRHITPKPPLKKVDDWTVAGKPQLKREAQDKTTGKALFAGDIRLPGMLYAKILRPPAHGAKLKSIDTKAAEGIPGARIVRDGDLVAALHELPDMAEGALAQIKADWELPTSKLDDKNIFEHLLSVAPAGRMVAQGGDLKAGETASSQLFEQTYLNSYVAHAAIETHTALAQVEGGKATVWASTQAPFRARDEVAQALSLPPASVRVITPFVGGGFGGKTRNLQAVWAARLAKLAEKPVQVAWSRGDEFFYDTFRPAAVVKIRSGIDGAGKIALWDYDVCFAGERSSQQFYAIPHHRTQVRGEWGGGGPAAHPFDVGAWRAPASNTNVFARESQIDIMAAKAKLDPLQFRLQNLSDRRMQRILKAAADRFGWQPAASPSGRGHGIVCSDYLGTYIATIAAVEIDRPTGGVQVKRVVCAQDMGVAVNPEGAAIQIEGCIMMGLGYALTEEVRFRGREILDLNFDSYEIPQFSWLPEIETVLVESKELPPSGGGEPAIINMGAVIACAIHDACGARLLQLPMTRERIKAALEQAKSQQAEKRRKT